MKKERVTVTIDQDVIAKIKQISKKESRSVSQMINLTLKEYIEKKEGK